MKKEEQCKSCAKITCPLHPTYKAAKQPKCSCKVCWDVWKRHQKDKLDKFNIKGN